MPAKLRNPKTGLAYLTGVSPLTVQDGSSRNSDATGREDACQLSAAAILTRSVNDLCLPRFRPSLLGRHAGHRADGVREPLRRAVWPPFETKWTTSGVTGILKEVAGKEPS
jgi:hypothetical protein